MSVTEGAATSKARLALLDNARYWVMLLVVVGHFLTSLVAVNDTARGIYVWAYSFHMPFFVLISGYTAQSYVGSPSQLRRIVSTLIVPYLLVEASLQLLMRHYSGRPETLMLLSPHWLGWFLIALVVWRLTTPLWRVIKYPITVSVIISLASGLIDIPNALAMTKVLGLLPFYVIGLHLNRDFFERLDRAWIRVVSWVILLSTLSASLLWSSDWNERWPTVWLLWKRMYSEAPLSVGAFEGIATRGLLIVTALILTVAAFAVIPRGRSWVTSFGEHTLYAYLLHGYVILILNKQFDLWSRIEPYGIWAVIGCVIAGIALANVLMTGLVQKAFRPLFEPRLNWLLRGS